MFHIPLAVGVGITAFDVLVILFFQSKGFRLIESIIASLIFVILACFTFEVIASHPDFIPLLSNLIPEKQIIYNKSMLYIAIEIMGATVMPHNLHLHSSIVQTRNYERNEEGKKMAIKFATIDSTIALMFAFFINAAILIVAGATFQNTGHQGVPDIMDAHKLLAPLLGTTLAKKINNKGHCHYPCIYSNNCVR